VNGNNKRIVVIKDIPSNFIEEAILILKSEPDTGDGVNKDCSSAKPGKKKDNEFLIKEAEMLINNYVKECKSRGIFTNEPVKKRRPVKSKFSINVAINIALVCSIAFLVFVLSKLL
jgi:hypothetical protein